MDRIITGIELGERELRVAVGRQRPDSIRMIAHMETPSGGIENQAVVDPHELAAGLAGISRKLRTTVDFVLESVMFVIPSGPLTFHETEASAKPSGHRGSVTESDGQRLLERGRPSFASNDRRLIHVIPQGYTLDGRETERLPIGKQGRELNGLTLSVSCETDTITNLREAGRLAGVENMTLMAGPLAESYAALTETERERGAAILSIGDHTSTLTVLHYGRFLGLATIAIGAHHFVNDLSIALQLPYPTAQAVLEQVTTLSNTLGAPRPRITVDGHEGLEINQTEMIATLRDRAGELFTLTQSAVEMIAAGRELPGGIVIAGQPILGGGLIGLARSILSFPVHRATPRGIEGIPLALSTDTAWVPAIGALAWAGVSAASRARPWVRTDIEQSEGVLGRWMRRARLRRAAGAGAARTPEITQGNQDSERAARRRNAAVARGNDRRARRRETVKA